MSNKIHDMAKRLAENPQDTDAQRMMARELARNLYVSVVMPETVILEWSGFNGDHGISVLRGSWTMVWNNSGQISVRAGGTEYGTSMFLADSMECGEFVKELLARIKAGENHISLMRLHEEMLESRTNRVDKGG